MLLLERKIMFCWKGKFIPPNLITFARKSGKNHEKLDNIRDLGKRNRI